MGSSTATLGLNYEADAISAAVIGGVSFVGGTGRISGVVLGVFMMQLIIAGMTFLGISGNVTYIVKGAVILFAVILDMRKYMTRKLTVSRCNGAESLVPSAFKHASQRLCTSCTEPLALSLWKPAKKKSSPK